MLTVVDKCIEAAQGTLLVLWLVTGFGTPVSYTHLIPTVRDDIRTWMKQRQEEEGLEALVEEPVSYTHLFHLNLMTDDVVVFLSILLLDAYALDLLYICLLYTS